MRTPYYFLPFLILLFSCTIDQESYGNDSIGKLSPLTQEVISRPSLQELKQAQGFLTTAERQALWETKLDFILNNPKENFSINQRDIILSLKNFLHKHDMHTLLSRPQLGIDFLNRNLAYWEKNFSKAQLNILIESPYLNKDMLISSFSEVKMLKMIGMSEKAAVAGGHCTCIYDGGCHGAGNFCQGASSCNVDDDKEMCGIFGTAHCENRCTGVQPDLD